MTIGKRGGARQGAGRRVVEDKAKARSIRVNDREWALIKEKADKRGKTVARFMIDSALKEE